MTAFGKLLRTTAFRLTLVYLAVFALFAAFVLAYFSWNTRRLITEQITETVDTEIRGLTEQYGQGGIRRQHHTRQLFPLQSRSHARDSNHHVARPETESQQPGDFRAHAVVLGASSSSPPSSVISLRKDIILSARSAVMPGI